MKKVYMDNVAATRADPRVVKAMMPYLRETFGNPLSIHDFGEEPREAVEVSRAKIASLINSQPEEIIYTGTGTEANNFAMKGIALAKKAEGKHIIVSSIEHPAVMNSVKTLEKWGFEVTYLPVDRYGFVSPEVMEKAIRKDTILVSINYANNEIGTIEPINELVKVVNEKGIHFHTDGVPAVGYTEIDVSKLGVDSMSISAHRFYGPKGVGALYLKKGTSIQPLIDGGIQEGGKRAGTDNVPGIVGFGKAAELAEKEMQVRIKKLSALRDSLIKGLLKIDATYLNGHPQKRLCYNANVCMGYVEGEALLLYLNDEGIAVDSGSACTSKALKASHVLLATGVDAAIAQGSLLFSLGINNSKDDVDYVVEKMSPIVDRLRQMSPLYKKS